MPPKKAMSIEESKDADALSMMSQRNRTDTSAYLPPAAAPDQVEQAPSTSVELRDGTFLNLTTFVNTHIQSFMAQKMALEKVEVKQPGFIGFKRPLESSSTHKGNEISKRRRHSLASVIDETGQEGEEQEYSQDEYESYEESGSEEDEEEPYNFSSVFGVGVNDDPPPRTVVEELGVVARSEVSQSSPARLPLPDDNRPVSEPVSRTHTQDLGDKGEAGEIVDKDLYVPCKNVPNWSPPVGILNWACKNFDAEWEQDQIKEYENRYVAPKEYRHIFTPIPLTKAMDQALSSQYTKDTDNFFGRRETERLLFRAAKDICVAYGPIFQVLTLLGDRGDCGSERTMLSEGVLGLASAMNRITRARRELLRRYFDFGVAKELYTFDPSHSQFFGGSSLDDRVKEAKALAEARNNLFFRPKPKTYKSNYANKNSKFYNKSAGFQDQSQQQKPQFKRRQNRGRGRRYKTGKGQTSTAKTSDSK